MFEEKAVSSKEACSGDISLDRIATRFLAIYENSADFRVRDYKVVCFF